MTGGRNDESQAVVKAVTFDQYIQYLQTLLNTMPMINLRVAPVFVGPASIGTVELIKLVRMRFDLSLADAKALVDRCVFEGETATLFTHSHELAEQFVAEVNALVSPAKFHVGIRDELA